MEDLKSKTVNGVDLVVRDDRTGNNQPAIELVVRDAAGIAKTSGIQVIRHANQKLKLVLGASDDSVNWELDVNGRVVVSTT